MTFRLSILNLLTLGLLGLFTLSSGMQVLAQDTKKITDLKTVAESSDYTATSLYADVLDFVDRCSVANHVARYDFGESVEGRAMVSTIIANPPYQIGAEDPRLKILLLGNIHSGECAGKEALLALLRELASDFGHPWLQDCVIMIAPNYNVDANERVGLFQRPGQAGPENGMGQRENSMQLDLNRDFCKLESPEARSLVQLIDQFDPHMFIDCHTTNGSRHQYVLTYDIPHNPTAPQALRDFMRNRMMPKITSDLEEQGVLTFYYGNLNRDNSVWSTYGHEPRYSTEYVGLRGRLGILSEAYSYASYQDRIEGTSSFVRQCVQFARDNKADVQKLLQDIRDEQTNISDTDRQRTLVHLQSEMSAFEGTFKIKGFNGDEKKDHDVTFLGNFTPVTSVNMPSAYVMPRELSMLAERLQMHGIEVEQVTEGFDTEIEVTTYEVNKINRANRAFQKHFMVNLEASSQKTGWQPDPGSFVIRTGQPLGRLVCYLLEPETNEGLVTWNFLDPWLTEGQPFPIVRVENDLPPNMTVPLGENEIIAGRTLQLKDIFGPDKIDLGELSINQVQWLDDGTTYTAEKNGRRIAIDAETGGEIPLPVPFDARSVGQALQEVDGPRRNELAVILSRGIQLRLADQKLFVIEHAGKTFVFDAETKKAFRLGDDQNPAELADLNPAGDAVAYVQANNLKVWKQGQDQPVAITADGAENLLHGKLDWVYQEELYGRGNFKAFWWSPTGDRIAFLTTDESPVNRYTVTDHIPVRGRLEVTAYPKAGDPLPNVSLHVFGLEDSKTQPIDLSKPDGEYLISRVSWNPVNSQLYVQLQDRIQSWLELNTIDEQGTALKPLMTDKTPAWIGTPGDPLFLPDGSFLWLSPRSGYKAIYRYSADGEELARLTNANWEVRDLLGCNFKDQIVYFTGSPDTPTQVVPLSVRLDGTKLRKLTEQPGTFAAKFGRTMQYFLAEHSTATSAEQISLYRADGSFVRHVIPNRDDQMRHLRISEPEFLEIPIGEEDSETVLDAMLIKPLDYDATKEYPVLVHVYGGPQTPRVRDRFGGQMYMWHQYMAQQGCLVFIVDNRSSSYRSAEQVWPIYRDMARRELADVEWAIGWLKENYKVDADRVGLWGWSYGGYMTAYALTHSKTFSCGVSGAPVTDWRNYDAIYTERYMDTPQNNPKGYEESSVLQSADDLHGQLLLVHGTIDDNVHISNTMQFVKALQQAGKQFQLMVYPENRHAVRDPMQRLHLYQLMTDFFNSNLKDDQ